MALQFFVDTKGSHSENLTTTKAVINMGFLSFICLPILTTYPTFLSAVDPKAHADPNPKKSKTKKNKKKLGF